MKISEPPKWGTKTLSLYSILENKTYVTIYIDDLLFE